MKIVVICGPNLKDHDSQVLNLLNSTTHELGDEGLAVVMLPETKLGAESVRNLVQTTIADPSVKNALFVTRYESKRATAKL